MLLVFNYTCLTKQFYFNDTLRPKRLGLIINKGKFFMDVEGWMVKNMESILWVIEILWVGGVAAIFVVYFVIKWRIKHKKTD